MRITTILTAMAIAAGAVADPPSTRPIWKHADMTRPRPSIVTPPTASTQDQPGRPPGDAIILFDGKDLSAFREFNPRGPGDDSKPAKWLIKDGYAQEYGNQIESRQAFADAHFHIEWRVPLDVPATTQPGQKRGNSGVEIGEHGEIQILDSYENDTYPDGQAAAIYGCWPPLVNASRPPGEWQTYDIYYFSPRFEDGKKVKSAAYTVIHNGLPVHHNTEVKGDEIESRLRFRPHGGKIHWRNIWVRPLHQYDENLGKPLPTGK